MKAPLRSALVLAIVLVGVAHAAPVKLIFDTDMGNDIDDALALALIHALQNRDECELLAVTITKDHEECPPYVDAINTFYGRGDIPIGITDSGVTPEVSRYTGIVQAREDGQLVYPHDLGVGDPVPGAVTILREALASAPDGSVFVVQVGFSTNLARLLDSSGDQHSKLTGKELVEKKVRILSIMAGDFDPIQKGPSDREYNTVNDVPASQKVANEWPTPIVWSGAEIGYAVLYPAESIDNDFRYLDRHIIQESYQAFQPTPHQRPSWDLTSVLWAVRPDRGYFDLSESGRVYVDDEGMTSFEETRGGQHRYLVLDSTQAERCRELFAALCSEPPRKHLVAGVSDD
jgi:inosine-uridine nucleoside N-ribohydrolase